MPTTPRTPPRVEIATVQGGKDITRGFIPVNFPLPTQDTVLAQLGSLSYYEDLLRDDQVRSCFQQRRLALTQRRWRVEPGAEDDPRAEQAAEEFREQSAALDWDRITDRMLYGLFYGYAVGECMWENRGGRVWLADVRVRKSRRFAFGPDLGLRLLTLEKPFGEGLPPGKMWTFSTGADNDDEPYGLGLGHSLYWPCWFKKHGIKFWLIFLDKFGTPTTKASVPSGMFNSETELGKIRSALQAIATDSSVIVPDGVALELLETARSGVETYDALVARMDAAIAKVCLSQTMTTDNGSSRSQAEVHADVKREVVESDSDLLHASFNGGPLRWWTDWNYGPEVPSPRLYRETEDPEDVDSLAERDAKLFAMGWQPTEERIREVYGEGYERKPASTIPPGDPLSLDEMQAFAEFGGLIGNRADQDMLVRAARMFSIRYRQQFGQRVDQLLATIEESGDLASFREQIAGLAADPPPDKLVEDLERASFMGRLLGQARRQRTR